MTPDQTATVEQSKGPPKGATHEYAGSYYQKLPNGVWLLFDWLGGCWCSNTVANDSGYFADKLRPITDPEVTPEEDEEWERKMAEQERQNNAVNHPDHYTQGGIECIEAIQAALTPEEFRGYCKGNALKYIWRNGRKGDKIEDAKKAEWYLCRFVDHERDLEGN